MKTFIKKYIGIIILFVGFLGFLSVWFLLPRKSEIDTIWQMFYKIAIFIIIISGVALFPVNKKWTFLLLILPILAFCGYIIPNLSYLCFIGVGEKLPNCYQNYYTHLYLITFPAILLSICFAYRVGGGTPGNCFKVGVTGMLILFSGFLDVMIYLVTPLEIPEKLIYAHHIAVVIGHYPSYPETIIFTLCHLPFIIAVLFLPIDKWVSKVLD